MVGSRRLRRLSAKILREVADTTDSSARAIAALSGGPDSAVLAWALAEGSGRVRAVHVHHGWPGSDRMEAAATAVAACLGLDLKVIRVDATGHGSPEEIARRLRYRALQRECRPGEVIATGHTMTDQAETVIGNVIWGSGLDGLGGMRRRRGNLIRPLLGITGDETREMATLMAWPVEDDPANHDSVYRRVRIRRVLVEWEAALAPGVIRRMAGLAGSVAPDLDLLNELSASVAVERTDSAVRIPIGELRAVAPGLSSRVIRRALRLLGDGHPGTRQDVEEVKRVMGHGGQGRVSGGYQVHREGTHVVIGRSEVQPSRPPLRLTEPGLTRWGDWYWQAACHSGRPQVFPISSWHQIFDMRSVPESGVVIRQAAGTDMVSLDRGTKRVAEALAEAGVPKRERSGWPVLAANDQVLWVPGVRRAYAGWVDGDTKSYLEVQATREKHWQPLEF